MDSDRTRYRFAEFSVRAGDFNISASQPCVEVTPKELALLLAIAAGRNETVSYGDLETILSSGQIVRRQSLLVLLSRLRRKLGDTKEPFRVIQTVSRAGLRIIPPVTVTTDVDDIHISVMRGITITLTTPREGQRSGYVVPIEGVVHGLPFDLQLWVVEEPRAGTFHPERGPIPISPRGEFRAIACIGDQAAGADHGSTFPLHIVTCTQQTGECFAKYIAGGHRTGSWQGLSSLEGATIVLTVRVIRD